jgi:hypothetical protein
MLTRLTQLIAANQIAGAVWVALATLVYGVSHDSALETVLALALAVLGVVGGVLALRGSRTGITILAVILALQIVRFANAAFAWQFYFGATWRVAFRPTAGSEFGFEGLFSIAPWPPGGGSLLEVNLTGLLATIFLLFHLYRIRGQRVAISAA